MSEMKKLVFGTGHLVPTLTGKKKITLRKYRPKSHNFKKDEVIIGVFKDGWDILLRITTTTKTKTFHDLSDGEAQEDGYSDAQDAFNGLWLYFPDLKWSNSIAIIRYEVLQVNNVPVVSIVTNKVNPAKSTSSLKPSKKKSALTPSNCFAPVKFLLGRFYEASTSFA